MSRDNRKPKLFIGSSTEQLAPARSLQAELARDAEVTVWDQGVFQASVPNIESLIAQLSMSDFAVFVFTPDDKLFSRGTTYDQVRDNVLFEFGLFVGAIGTRRCFIVAPPEDGARVPSDLLGITVATYDEKRIDIRSALGPACNQIREGMRSELARRSRFLANYIADEEPSLLNDGRKNISLDRAYKLLLYMFRREIFDSFYAFDLAFHRWEELLHSSTQGDATSRAAFGQAVNISAQVFAACSQLFQRGYCRSFKRLMVIDFDKIAAERATQIITRIEEQEGEWQSLHKDLAVETRVLPWKPVQPQQEMIAQLHDFAAFCGSEEYLAIVETTLTSPEDHVANPQCDVLTDAKSVTRLIRGFDDFWAESLSLGDAKKRMLASIALSSPSGTIRSGSRPAVLARDHFFSRRPDLRLPCAVIIEAAYIDLRTPEDEERISHLTDAIWLHHELAALVPTVRDRILLETFINDFSIGEGCGVEFCNLPGGTQEARGIILERLKRIKTLAPAISEEYALFWMRRTRNHVVARLIELLHREDTPLWDNPVDHPGQILVDTRIGPVVLGHRAADGSHIVPRCAALMAQHYYDLYQYAMDRDSQMRELWIFDFNRLTEADAVQKGAEAAYRLFAWPDGFRLRIVNVVYAGVSENEYPLQAFSIP